MLRFWTLQEALTYGKGTERPFLCPVHGDSRPSASVNTIKNVWVCYSCGAHGSLTGEDALLEPDYEVMQQWFNEKMETPHVYTESWLSRFCAGGVHPYWESRVGSAAARHFKLGWDPELDAGTYPLRGQSGEVLGVVRRNLSGDGPKYLYPKGVDVGRLLFNYDHRGRDLVVLCEGALDAIALWNVGVDAFAIYGARLGPEQVRLIERLDPLYVFTAYDNDDAGGRARWDTEKAFEHRLVDHLTWPLSWGKDVGELTEDRLKKVVSPIASVSMSCVGSTTWHSESPDSTKPRLRIKRNSSGSTSQPSRLRIRPTGT